MTKRSTSSSSKGASSSYVEQGWDLLTDTQLLEVQWVTDNPSALPDRQPTVPPDLGEFQIEMAYDLSPQDDPVPCAHCPQHQKHRHGFVLRDAEGRRYLLGSTCGPKAYGSDYRVASNARKRAERRWKALTRWMNLRDDLPDEIAHFDEMQSSPAAKAVRGMYAAFERVPATLKTIRELRPSGLQGHRSLSTVNRRRDLALEAKIEEAFLTEVAALDPTLNRRNFNSRRQEIIDRLGRGKPIYVTEERDLGHLQGAEWLRSPSNPTIELTNRVRTLRGLHAQGRTTEGKPTNEVERLIQNVEREVAACESAAALVAGASVFFEPDHLGRLAEWLNCRADCAWSAKANGRLLVISENDILVSLTLG